MLKRLGYLVRGIAAALALALVLVAATPQGRAAVDTALLLPQLVPTVPLKPQTWVFPDPIRDEARYPIEGGLGKADLYAPAGDGTHSAVLLFLGVNPAGSDDPRVVGLAEGLARAGLVVMIPWSDTMTRQRVTVDEVDNLVRAYQFLLAHERVDAERSGMGGFCVGASFAAMAAADPRVRDDVAFLNFFGGYYDARDLAASVVSSSRFRGSEIEGWSPDRLSQDVVATHLIEGMADGGEVELLRRVFATREVALDDREADALSPEARTVYRLLSGVELGEARRLISELSESSAATLRAISPSSTVGDLSARVLIMHDREDALVPSEESQRLADALAERGDVYHTEFSLFDHLDPTRPVSPPVYAREMFKLYLHMYNVLREVG